MVGRLPRYNTPTIINSLYRFLFIYSLLSASNSTYLSLLAQSTLLFQNAYFVFFQQSVPRIRFIESTRNGGDEELVRVWGFRVCPRLPWPKLASPKNAIRNNY